MIVAAGLYERVFGGFGAANLSTDLTEKIETNAPRGNSRTAVNIPPAGQSYEDQTGKMKWMAGPQITVSPRITCASQPRAMRYSV